jgi:hypothetical protein
MIEITIEYPHYLFFKRKEVGTLPTAWAELTEHQFIAISRIIHGIKPDYQFLSLLTGINSKRFGLLSPYELKVVTDGIDFIRSTGNFLFEFIIKHIKGTKLVSPHRKLEGMPFGQFIFADAYYHEYMATKKEDSLNHFIAYLYLLPGESFNKESIDSRLGTVAKIHLDTRKAIAYNYSLILVWLQKAYPLIFQVVSEEALAKTDQPPAKALTNSPWIRIFDILAEDDLFTSDQWGEIPVHTIFRYLSNQYRENAKRN